MSKLESICEEARETPETHYIDGLSYQIYVISYIILKLFFPTIPKNVEIEKIINIPKQVKDPFTGMYFPNNINDAYL